MANLWLHEVWHALHNYGLNPPIGFRLQIPVPLRLNGAEWTREYLKGLTKDDMLKLKQTLLETLVIPEPPQAVYTIVGVLLNEGNSVLTRLILWSERGDGQNFYFVRQNSAPFPKSVEPADEAILHPNRDRLPRLEGMATDIKLSRFNSTPWGFRLSGGVDFPHPLTVVRVARGSLADDAGLQPGDVLIRINDRPLQDLTHAQAHDWILRAGNNFVVSVVRNHRIAAEAH